MTVAAITPSAVLTRHEFAGALTALREAAGLTVRDVARETGISVSTLGGYFSGRHVPQLKPHRSLADILRVCGVTDLNQVAQWYAALARVRRLPGPRAASEPPPYKGLASFQPEDARFFFGRKRVVELVIAAVDEQHRVGGGFVFLVGPSGSGKSSVLRAGLIAELAGRRNHVLFTPTAQTIFPDDVEILVVDQFEEIFTADDEVLGAQLIGTLERVADAGVVVLVALRADFYGHAMRQGALLAGLRDAQILLPPMNESELREAILGPAAEANLDLEAGLVELLLKDMTPARLTGGPISPVPGAAHEGGALPLLSHCLLTMWQSCGRAGLTVAGYRSTGGLQAAVSETAEQVFLQLTADQQEITRDLFLRMVTVREEGWHARHRVSGEDLLTQHCDETTANDIRQVLDVFVECRLVTADQDAFEITHEVLIGAWPRLVEWIAADAGTLRLRRALAHAIKVWQESGQDQATLYRGAPLAAMRDWAERPGTALTPTERAFLDRSVAHQHDQHTAALRTARRLTRLAVAWSHYSWSPACFRSPPGG
jgi:transcriptional regulator with XRE-family HTH domain